MSTIFPLTHIFSPFGLLTKSRNTSSLESYYDGRSADLTWQLLFASASIIVRTIDSQTSTYR